MVLMNTQTATDCRGSNCKFHFSSVFIILYHFGPWNIDSDSKTIMFIPEHVVPSPVCFQKNVVWISESCFITLPSPWKIGYMRISESFSGKPHLTPKWKHEDLHNPLPPRKIGSRMILLVPKLFYSESILVPRPEVSRLSFKLSNMKVSLRPCFSERNDVVYENIWWKSSMKWLKSLEGQKLEPIGMEENFNCQSFWGLLAWTTEGVLLICKIH